MKSKHGDPAVADPVPVAAVALRAPLTDRVNADPPIFNGMTASEGVKIAVLCLIVYIIVGGLLTLLTGVWPILPGVTLFGTIATLWYGSLYLAKIKRNRPEGYYNLAINLWLAARGFAKHKFILRSDYWSLGRDMPFGGFTSPLVVHDRAARRQPPGKREIKHASARRTGAVSTFPSISRKVTS